MYVKTRIIEADSVFRFARVIEVSVGSKTIITPKRALSASTNHIYDETVLKGKEKKGLTEIYLRINHENLRKAMDNEFYRRSFTNKLSSLLKKAADNITIGIVECDFAGNVPTKEETEFIVHLLNNPDLDILVSPILLGVPAKDYVKFLDQFAEIHQTCSFHAILAPVIPHYSTADIPKLFKYYMSRDEFEKNFICVDFNGGNPISQYDFVSSIVYESQKMEKEFNEPCFRYAINLKYGKATKKQQVVPAKDLTIFAMGFNAFGSNHRIIPILGDIGNYELKAKLLNRTDYGYYSIDVAKDSIIDAGSYEIDLKSVLRNIKYSRVFNAERQALETLAISTAVKENRLIKYLESKPRLNEDPSIFKKVHKINETTQEPLPKFFS